MPATGLNRYLPDWVVTNVSGIGGTASASRPASPAPPLAESRHVCTSISATLVATTAVVGQAQLNLRDGATGAGTILASWVLGVQAAIDATTIFALGGLEIIGSPNTAMTLEFAGIAGAGTIESVTLTGHTL